MPHLPVDGEFVMPQAKPSFPEITDMLRAWSKGSGDEANELFPVIYDELRRQAHQFLRRERPGHTLQTSALINETYLKLSRQQTLEWQSRIHFFAICATLMRRILVDYAKTRNRAKRGASIIHVPIDDVVVAAAQNDVIELLDLDEALNKLAEFDVRQARIAELRFFSGFDVEDTARILGISRTTVKREWRIARAWLGAQLTNGSVQ